MLNLPVNEWLEILRSFYDQYGYSIVFLGSLGENTAFLGLLLPGNSLVLLGALYAKLGTLNLGLVILWATLGTIIGYHIDFLFGRFVLSHAAARWSTSRLGRRLRIAGRLRLARMFIARHGGKAIIMSHIVGHLRSFVAIGAGMTHMPYRTFLVFEVIAAVLWNTLYACLGYFVAIEIDQLALIIQRTGGIILVVLLLLFIAWRFFGPRIKQGVRRRKRQMARQQKKAMSIHGQ